VNPTADARGPARPGLPPGPVEVTTRLVGLALGPLLFGAVLAWPLPALSAEAHRLAAIFAWAVAYWATEAVPVPVTALLSSVLAIVLGVAPAKTVLGAYGDPIIFLVIGSFILAQAMRVTGLDRRFAFALLRHRWATRTPSRILATVGIATCGISLWVSNTATTAIMLPVGVGILSGLGAAGDPRASRFPIGLLLMLTWGSSVAVGVPVGSPPNLIAIGMVRDLAGRRLTFVDWVAVTLPLTAAMLLACWLLLRWLYREQPGAVSDIQAYVAAERAKLGPWSRAEVNVAAVFLVACALWTLPGLVGLAASPEAPFTRALETYLPESAVGLLAAVLLFVLPTDLRRASFTIEWTQAARIDWGTVVLFGGGLALGRLMFDTKLAAVMGGAIVRASGVEGVWGLTAVAIVIGVLLSEASSNTAAASMVLPVVIAVAQGTGLSPVPPALGATLGASFGFMLPVSTPPNAIVYGSGLVPLREMIRSGIWLDVVGVGLIWAGLRVLCPLFGVM
jgi:sodium-dependent dicarboxylate transporter 2/3/5